MDVTTEGASALALADMARSAPLAAVAKRLDFRRRFRWFDVEGVMRIIHMSVTL